MAKSSTIAAPATVARKSSTFTALRNPVYRNLWLATLLSGQAALPQAKNSDIYLASLGILLTAVYIYGLIFRPRRQVLNMGIDSLVVLILYLVGLLGLIALAHG